MWCASPKSVDELSRDEEATVTWRQVYGTLTRGEPEMVGAIIGRAEAQVLRLSALYAVLDRSRMIRTPHLLAALAFWEYAEASARRIFGDRLGDHVAEVILDALRARRSTVAPASRTRSASTSRLPRRCSVLVRADRCNSLTL
jgi:hypothetical protein